MEQTQYNLLFRWFMGLSMDDTVWVPTVFTRHREHFSVDGTLIQAGAGHKSFGRKDGGEDDMGGFKARAAATISTSP